MLHATGWSLACVLSPDQAAELKQILEFRKAGKEQGVLGLYLDSWPSVEVVPGAPAAEAGLQNGDKILMVNGMGTSTVSTASEAMRLLGGPAGDTVRLTIDRGDQKLTYDVRRASKAVFMIRANLVKPDVLVIQIPTFEGSGIGDKVKQIVHQYVDHQVKVIIFDLRNNPGGRPEEANAVADLFLDKKILEVFKFLDGRQILFESHPGQIDIRLLVLVNRNTGSAAEMLAMALRGNHRALIVGETTAGALFGKAFEELKERQMIAFRTEPTILSLDGEDFSIRGFPPDIPVTDTHDSGKDRILERALETAERQTAVSTERSSQSRVAGDND
jgi:carboxyl-terminal processing protease